MKSAVKVQPGHAPGEINDISANGHGGEAGANSETAPLALDAFQAYQGAYPELYQQCHAFCAVQAAGLCVKAELA